MKKLEKYNIDDNYRIVYGQANYNHFTKLNDMIDVANSIADMLAVKYGTDDVKVSQSKSNGSRSLYINVYGTITESDGYSYRDSIFEVRLSDHANPYGISKPNVNINYHSEYDLVTLINN